MTTSLCCFTCLGLFGNDSLFQKLVANFPLLKAHVIQFFNSSTVEYIRPSASKLLKASLPKVDTKIKFKVNNRTWLGMAMDKETYKREVIHDLSGRKIQFLGYLISVYPLFSTGKRANLKWLVRFISAIKDKETGTL